MELIPENGSSRYNRPRHYLLRCNDDREASTAFEQSMINGSRKIKPSHHAVCDVFDDDKPIKGVRFVYRTCADTDLCSDCMGRYHSESLTEQVRVCQGYEFTKVPSDDGEELPDRTLT